MTDQVTKAAGISSEAVKAKTGKSLDEWFAILDKAGAAKWAHKAIAAHLGEVCGCPRWWRQMVAVGYEQARGIRVKNQASSGHFNANASKTIAVTIELLYRSWSEAELLGRWLPDAAKMIVRKANVNKSMRITWIDGKSDESNVEVNFWVKGQAKRQVAVQHGKLKSAREVARWKAYWGEALGRLQGLLERTIGSAAPSVLQENRRRRGDAKRVG